MTESSSTHDPRPVRHGAYPEFTWPAILVGWAIGIVIALSIGYLSLKLGFSIEGSELAAILGFGILRGLMGRTSIIENNINQTIASAVNGASSGMMFSVPAIFILGYGNDFNRVVMVLGCIAGGILGVAFVIPLRKQMIDFNRLTYPGGIATAAVLRSPGAGLRKAKLLLGAAAFSGALHFVSLWTGVENYDLGALVGLPEYMNGIWYLSLLTIGVGYLAGRGGFFFIVGGFVCYWLLAPLLSVTGQMPGPETLQGTGIATWLRLQLYRPVGIGMLVGGALTGIVLAFPLVVSAVRSLQQASQSGARMSQDEMPVKMLWTGVALAFVVLSVIAVISNPEIGVARGILMAVLGTLWIWVAGVVLAECIGRTNWSPLSGMTLIGVTILILVSGGLGLFEPITDRASVVASVLVGGAMCVAMSQATDLMLDLKTGYLIGAIPRKQQIAQWVGVWLGPIVIMMLILVLHQAYGLGSDALPAPQGQALASVVEGILGGDVPAQKYAAGALIGALLSASGIGGLGVLVGLGFYLPFNIVLTYSLGTLSRIFTDSRLGGRWAEDTGIPLAAGLIVGEALVGVGFSIAKVALAGG